MNMETQRRFIILMIALFLLITACTATALPAAVVEGDSPAEPTGEAAAPESDDAVQADPPADPTVAKPEEAAVTQPEDTAAPAPEETPTSEPEDASQSALLPAENPPSGAAQQFSTDFSIHTVPYSEILSGGPPKDGIPAIDNPQFVSVDEADQWLEDLEPVSVYEENGDVRIYP